MGSWNSKQAVGGYSCEKGGTFSIRESYPQRYHKLEFILRYENRKLLKIENRVVITYSVLSLFRLCSRRWSLSLCSMGQKGQRQCNGEKQGRSTRGERFEQWAQGTSPQEISLTAVVNYYYYHQPGPSVVQKWHAVFAMIKSAGDLLQMSAFGLWVYLNMLLDIGLLYFMKVVANIFW